ncbi:signal peptidase I [Pantoea rodasii]|uniref:Signal peptidase I n=1 Tax=Pantoea rodasii TaxID=1076549 RepID=A0A2M9W6N3_9GAMM|nr:signal peptidase I [Pantoea rodasii]ORM62773.1 S26 family signal peptidase [Pantoea rodasii]PJZ03187.1 signal peptidase I [Pantoea rodasii]
MMNIFALILTIAVVFTGLSWGYRVLVKASPTSSEGLDRGSAALKPTAKARLPGWLDTSASLFPLLAVVLLVRAFGWEPFRIPSGSMMPTLLTGDWVLADKYSYGLRNPFNQKTLIATGHPQRGDIAIFTFPQDESQLFIKRVIGLPGDKVVFNPATQQLTIFPACQGPEPCASTLTTRYSALKPSEFVETAGAQPGFYVRPFGQETAAEQRLLMRTETLAGVTHRILQKPDSVIASQQFFHQSGQQVGEWVVPAGEYFMMGDNRNNSYDGRYWGFVPERNLVGKAVAIWFSMEKQEGQWPTGLRLNRIGRIH